MHVTKEAHEATTTAFVEYRADITSDNPAELMATAYLPPREPFVVSRVLLACSGETMETLDRIKVYAWGDGDTARCSAEWTHDGLGSHNLRNAPQFVFDLFRDYTEHHDLLLHLTRPVRETRS
jgi:hypothetical protein